jgi:tartrate-resistant acid phosphatase type 5
MGLSQALAADPSLRFAVIGDYGNEVEGKGDSAKQVADLVKSWKPEFIITTGDNNYPTGEKETFDKNVGKHYRDFLPNYTGEFFPYSKPDMNRFYPSLGNHDWECKKCVENQKPKPYLDYFELPGNERYYTFTWGKAEFFVLDSDPRVKDIKGGVNSVQAKWLKKELSKSTALYRVVYFHHPPFSSGKHGDHPHMQWPFAAWGASIVLSGHDHNYERLIIDEIPYVVVGTSGNVLYDIPGKKKGSLIRDNSGFGAMFVEEEQKSLLFRYFLANGKFIDSFRVRAKLAPKLKPRKTSTYDLR